LAELNPRTCVVLGGRGFLGRSLVHRLLTLGKWIVRVADSAQSLHPDPSDDHHDSLLSQALSSGRASYHRVDVRDYSQIVKGMSSNVCVDLCMYAFMVGTCLDAQKMRQKGR
jgi:nucleoside-diphosphate-sugar epimerase